MNTQQRFIRARKKLVTALKRETRDCRSYDEMIERVAEFILSKFRLRKKSDTPSKPASFKTLKG